MKRKLHIGLFLLDIELKIKLFFIRHIMPYWRKCMCIFAAMIALSFIVSWVVQYRTSFRAYYYIDYNDNRGVASNCWEGAAALYCNRKYNGKIKVREYWRGE